MAIYTEAQKRQIQAIIDGLRIIKKKYLARTITSSCGRNLRSKGLCAAAEFAYSHDDISKETYQHITLLIQRLLQQSRQPYIATWLSTVFVELNPERMHEIQGQDLECQMRHMLLNQIIRDYTKLLKG